MCASFICVQYFFSSVFHTFMFSFLPSACPPSLHCAPTVVSANFDTLPAAEGVEPFSVGCFLPPPPTIYTFSMPGVCQVCSPSPKANSSTSPQLTAFVWHPKTAFSIFWSDLLQRWSQPSEFLPRTPRDRHRWGTWITVKNSPPDSALRISQLAAMKARSQTAHLLRI